MKNDTYLFVLVRRNREERKASLLVTYVAGSSQVVYKGPWVRTGFYPKPRVDLGKGSQPLRCNPILIEHIGAQGHHGRAVDPFPPHAPFFHTAVDHQGHGPLDHATADRIALLSPVLIGTDPGSLVLQIGK